MDYKLKYLKYKNKYLELKKTLVLQIGGNFIPIVFILEANY